MEGIAVANAEMILRDPQHFFDVTWSLPAELVAGRSKVRVRFEAREGSQVAALLQVRSVRSDE